MPVSERRLPRFDRIEERCDGGGIVEIGTHDELVERDGSYAAQLRAGLTVA